MPYGAGQTKVRIDIYLEKNLLIDFYKRVKEILPFLSSLLPYLPMLMDPLVSALNGSQNLVTQVNTSIRVT